MKVGTVTGSVWATKKCPALTGQSLLRVRVGERVILAFGAAARLARPNTPADAAIVAILDEQTPPVEA